MDFDKIYGIPLEMKPFAPLVLCFMCGIIGAIVTFSNFQSSANVTIQNMSFTGATAAFIGTFFFAFTVYSNIYDKASQKELAKKQEIIDDLRMRIVKGAPCPEGFVMEIDEKHKFVFSRPTTWKSQQGMLYYFSEEVPQCKKGTRKTTGRFLINFIDYNTILEAYKIDKTTDFQDLDYKMIYDMLSKKILVKRNIELQKTYPGYKLIDSTNECVDIDGIPSLRINQSFSVPAKELIASDEDENCYPDKEENIVLINTRILTYNKRLKGLYEFSSIDNTEDYVETSKIFNQVVASTRFI